MQSNRIRVRHILDEADEAWRLLVQVMPVVVPKKRRLIMSELIISNPKIMMGKPVIKGTRITVELILEKIAAGESVDQILNEHPRLTHEAIQASCA